MKFRKKLSPEIPLWSEEISNGCKLQVQTILEEYKERPRKYVIVLRTTSGSTFQVGEASGSTGVELHEQILQRHGVSLQDLQKTIMELQNWVTTHAVMTQ